jgi:hypothetical protein
MIENMENFKDNLSKILEESDDLDLSEFTFDLLDCIWADILDENEPENYKNLVEAYANEIESSLEIFNPELKTDIEILEKVLKELQLYIETY